MTSRRSHMLLLAGALLLGSCQGGTPEPTAATPTPEPVISPSPSATEEPRSVMLVIPDSVPPAAAERVYSTVLSLAGNDGLELVRETSFPGELSAGYELAIMIDPDSAFLGAASQYPQVTFVAIAITGQQPTDNLWILGPGSGEDRAAFLSGYIAVMLTEDWRTGAVEWNEAGSGARLDYAFINGGIYFCGLCRPQHPPYVAYPAAVPMPELSPAAASAALAAAEAIDLQTLWLPAQVIPLFDALTLPSGMRFIGPEAPADQLADRWVATVRPAPEQALVEAWSAIRAGGQPAVIPIPLILEKIDSTLLTPGKLAQIEEIRAAITDGLIDPGAYE